MINIVAYGMHRRSKTTRPLLYLISHSLWNPLMNQMGVSHALHTRVVFEIAPRGRIQRVNESDGMGHSGTDPSERLPVGPWDVYK